MAFPREAIKQIFIGGAPRSGTTMLASILGSHTQVLATSETQFKFELAPCFSDRTMTPETLFHLLQRNRRFRIFDLNISKEQIDFSGLALFMKSIVDQYSFTVNKPDYRVWADVTPVNLRHSSFLNSQFPDCLFIHLVRDGRAVYASQKKVDFGSNDPVFGALKWMEAISMGLATEMAFPNRCLRVNYENILKDPAKECNRMCGFMKIGYEEKMLEGGGIRKSSYISNTHQLVGKKPDPSKINEWNNVITSKEIYRFESMTYDLLDLLGYERVNKGILKKPGEIAQARIMLAGALKYLTINKWKNRRRFEKNT